MRLIRGLSHLQPCKSGCVLTIGNFDGVHLGHQTVIQQAIQQAKQLSLPLVVIIFEPHPLEYFLGEHAPSRLTRLREKIIQLQKLAIDKVVVIKFNLKFANYSAEEFIQHILITKLNVKHLVIGDDFHFGKARVGNFSMLKTYGKQYGFEVENTQSYYLQQQRISSTLIRDILGNGDLILAKQMLGRDYSICGRVAHGDKLGRTLGFPTANIQLFRKTSPIRGVFAITMLGINQQILYGVANVGNRPSVNGNSKVLLETHLFNFDQSIYGCYVEIKFHFKLRDEARFASLDKLKQQIQLDIKLAQNYFNKD